MFPPKTSDRTVVLSRNAHDSVESWITQIKRVGFYVNPSFTPEQFPAIKEHTWQSTTLRFFPFNPKKGSPLFQLKRRRLGRPTYEHGLCFAALYPSYPENVLFFHEPVYLPHVLHWGGFWWGKEFLFWGGGVIVFLRSRLHYASGYWQSGMLWCILQISTLK